MSIDYTLNIPPEGLKLVAKVGDTSEGNAIWKQFGLLKLNRNNKPIVLIDRTFNPAGVPAEPNTSSMIAGLYAFSPEELAKKKSWQQAKTSYLAKSPNSFSDMDDDIPF